MRPVISASTAILSVLALTATVTAAPSTLSPQTVTLITGDQVTLGASAERTLHMRPGKGREHIRFVAQYEPVAGERDPHLYVIPQDAAPLIAADQLDRQLFDITALVDSRYDDARSDGLPLIVTYAAQARALAASGASLSGAVVTRQLSSINALALKAPKQQIDRFWSTLTSSRTAAAATRTAPLSLSGQVKKIWLDRRLRPLLDRSVPQIGAPTAWNAGFFGDGVVVAVIDTGVDLTHPDLAGKVVAHRNFTTEEDKDLVGHGTHVASIVAGSGAASGGKYRGVAPGAQLISGKVCLVFGCEQSSIISGMQWAVIEEGAKIVNLSLGGSNGPEIDPLEQAVNELTENYGALFVVAAGNFGTANSVSSPSTADAALSVGAIDRDENVAFFSSRGPRAEDNGIKPEITAPGVDIMAARADGATSDNFYVAFSGTSMATPHVAGAAALLSQLHPEWGPQQLKAALIGTAKRNPSFPLFDQGAGRVDVSAAFATSVTADPSTLSLGVALWPHDDDVPVTRSVTYRNSGSTVVTLTLKVDATGPSGAPAPQGMFTLSPTTLTIPAGASASAELTVDTRVGAPDGAYSGTLVAEVEGRNVATPLAIEREAESYDVQVRHIGSGSGPVFLAHTTFVPLDRPLTFPLPGVDFAPEEVRVRLPAGRYAVDTPFIELGSVTVIHDSVFRVDAPQSLTIDARAASPIEVVPPTSGSVQFWNELNWTHSLSSGSTGTSLLSFGAVSVRTQNLDGPAESFISSMNAQWDDASAGDTQARYAAAWVQRGNLVTGPTKAVDLSQVATVHATYASAFPNIVSGLTGIGAFLRESLFSFIPSTRVTLPHRRTEFYYGPDAGVRWLGSLRIPLADEVVRFEAAPLRYAPGRRYTSRWNEPPFAPAFPVSDVSLDWAFRSGDVLVATLPLFGDQAGHAGFAGSDSHLELFRNGEKIGEADGVAAAFDVTPEAASYRLHATASQNAFGLSTRVTAAWTFASEHVAETTTVRLPLLSLQFKPRLNERGQALRNTRSLIPIIARQLTQQDPVTLSALRLEASFDDGKSWSKVPVLREGSLWIASIKHPRQGDHVSLRATAQDSSGNSLEETVIRAYGLTDAPAP